MGDPRSLAGKHVLVVEDEMLVSLLIEDLLERHNCIIVGPFDRYAAALQASGSLAFDLALLDVNVAGDKIYPVAEIIASRNIPFLLLSGYGRAAVPREHPEWLVCSKPFEPRVLMSMLAGLLDDGSTRFLTPTPGA